MPPRGPVRDLLDLEAVLDEDQRAVRDTVRRYADERLRPNVANWFETGRVPVRELARDMAPLGILGMHLEGYGCAGAGATTYGLVCQELEAVDSGLRSLVSVQGSLAMQAVHGYGTEEQRQRWLPDMAAGAAVGCFALTEHDAGSDPGSMRTTARRDGAGWVLDGTKMWITNAPVADVAVVWARADGGVRGFLVPLSEPGVTVREVPRKLSLRASLTGEIALQGVRLPADALLPGAEGLGAPLRCLTSARLGIVFGAVGAGRECLEAATEYARERRQFGRPIAGFQLTQAKLADAAVRLAASGLLALHLGRLAEAGRLRPEQVSAGKLHTVRTALDVARNCRTVLGANGLTLDYPVLRHALNLETVLTYEGTSEVHQLVVGKALTGEDAFR